MRAPASKRVTVSGDKPPSTRKRARARPETPAPRMAIFTGREDSKGEEWGNCPTRAAARSEAGAEVSHALLRAPSGAAADRRRRRRAGLARAGRPDRAPLMLQRARTSALRSTPERAST